MLPLFEVYPSILLEGGLSFVRIFFSLSLSPYACAEFRHMVFTFLHISPSAVLVPLTSLLFKVQKKRNHWLRFFIAYVLQPFKFRIQEIDCISHSRCDWIA